MKRGDRKNWNQSDDTMTQSVECKNGVLEEFLKMCQQLSLQDQDSMKSVNSKHQTIRKHYAQQKCRIEHQFKYIVTLLEQKKSELLNQLSHHEQQLDAIFNNIQLELQQINELIDSIQNDITSNQTEIVSQLDDTTFTNVLHQFQEQIQNAQIYKRDILSQKINLIIIEEWSPQHQESIKTLVNTTITFKDYHKQIETPSEMSASTSSNRSQEIKPTPLMISFDQKYFLQKSSQFCMTESDAHDSCESDFLREWVSD